MGSFRWHSARGAVAQRAHGAVDRERGGLGVGRQRLVAHASARSCRRRPRPRPCARSRSRAGSAISAHLRAVQAQARRATRWPRRWRSSDRARAASRALPSKITVRLASARRGRGPARPACPSRRAAACGRCSARVSRPPMRAAASASMPPMAPAISCTCVPPATAAALELLGQARRRQRADRGDQAGRAARQRRQHVLLDGAHGRRLRPPGRCRSPARGADLHAAAPAAAAARLRRGHAARRGTTTAHDRQAGIALQQLEHRAADGAATDRVQHAHGIAQLPRRRRAQESA